MEEEKSIINNNEIQTKLLVEDEEKEEEVRKGGMKTMPFIIVNEAFQEVANFGLSSIMIFYLTDVYHMSVVSATSLIFVWSALSNGLSIFGAFLADSYLGRFRVIALGSISSLVGITFLLLSSVLPQLTPSSCNQVDATTCDPATPTQLAFLLLSLGLLSIGCGCSGPCSMAFGADQLRDSRDPNNQRLIDSYLNWYYASITISIVVAITVIVYIQDQFGWAIGYSVAVFLMICSVLMFLLGSSRYVKLEATESLVSGFLQVLTVAYKNRNIVLRDDDCYNHNHGSDRVELTEGLRFLNKACIVRNLNMDPSAVDPWSLSTVEKVESVKSIIRILPVWSSGIIMFNTGAQNFPTLQAETMNRHVTSSFEIPAASFALFMVFAVTLWIVVYDRILVPLISKYTHHPRGLHPKIRIGIGLLMSVLAMVVSAIVETIRRDIANSSENPKATVEMSAMWLAPQYVLLGLAEGMTAIGQLEFFYSELPNSMLSLGMAMIMVSMAIAGLVGSVLVNIVDSITSGGGKVSWLSSDMNEGHVDYYYWFLCFLNLLNLVYFVICWRVYRSISSSRDVP